MDDVAGGCLIGNEALVKHDKCSYFPPFLVSMHQSTTASERGYIPAELMENQLPGRREVLIGDNLLPSRLSHCFASWGVSTSFLILTGRVGVSTLWILPPAPVVIRFRLSDREPDGLSGILISIMDK